jgi:hypothetical protein
MPLTSMSKLTSICGTLRRPSEKLRSHTSARLRAARATGPWQWAGRATFNTQLN